MSNYLVYDLGGTFIKYALMNEQYEIEEQGKVPSALDNLDHLLDAMVKIADGFKGRYGGAAVSMPGRIDTAKGIAYTGGSYAFIHDLPIADLLKERLHCDVVCGNDGKCAAKAEAAAGSLKDTEDGAAIVLGTGTGGGIILHHQVWMGTSGGAGELSVLLCNIDELVKNGFSLQNFSCIYAGYASATGLISQYAKCKHIPLMQALQSIDGLSFFQAYDEGEQEAHEALEQFGLYTAAGILSIQSVLDLEKYAIGGGISARKEVTDSIRSGVEKLYSCDFQLPYSKPEITTCTFHNDANLVGALSFYLDRK